MTVKVTLEFSDTALAAAFLQSYTVFFDGKPAKSAKAPKAAPEPVPPAATPAASPATTPAPTPLAQSPEAPTYPVIAKVNAVISELAGKNRDAAIAILRKHGAEKTPQLKPEVYQAVIDDADEALAKLDAASVTASLV